MEMLSKPVDIGTSLTEDTLGGDGKNTPFCIGMQRNKLLTRKVATELSFVMNGGAVSDSVIEFANEWWNFRYHTSGKNIKLLGPSVGRKLFGGLQDADKNAARTELAAYSTIILPIQFSYTCEPAGISSVDEQWSLLVVFPKSSLVFHFDSGIGAPNSANCTAQTVTQKLFDILGSSTQRQGSFNLKTLSCTQQQNQADSGLYSMATAACLAKYIQEILGKTEEKNLEELLSQLIRCNITPDYIVFLRSFLKRLHSKLHQKLYESVMLRRSFSKDRPETENLPQKRKLEGSDGGSDKPRRKVESLSYTILDLEEMEKDMFNFRLS